MTAVALAGWAVAALALAAALRAGRTLARRAEAVARACHEVRGPLTAIGLGVSLSARPEGLTPAHLRAVQTELERTALAVNDLAAASLRSVPPPPRPQPVSMCDLLDDAVIAAQGRALAAGVAVDGRWEGPDAVVWGERLRLAQALGNLVANATEHGGGVVRVTGARRGALARVEVADSGCGLPASVAELARRPRAGRGARGRGLAIAAAIADRHGGTLATAPAAQGAVVVLTLPVLAAAHVRDA
jgi:signal transduction histidine kinase